MSAEILNLTPALHTYLQNHSLREPEVLKNLRKKTHTLSNYIMQISPEQGQFMALLMEMLNAKKTLDIGTFTGYSALVVALALPADGKVIACDVNTEWTEIGKEFWQQTSAGKKIDLRIAPATETLQHLLEAGEGETFDFAFIDADKTNYLHYYELSLALLRRGGLIAVDNVLRNGEVIDLQVQDKNIQAIRALNEKILNDERVSISMLPIGDGLTLARKR
ncbi:MAG: class I SAM-dependent methyltransferase [Gammaproteobacteria bacterium]|nr:class I SAM-dependent methyltransferase [Gammaproteobacteria bacterium]